MRKTLGLTGLTINAMALIAPGAFLWLTFQEQASYGAPMAGSAMWFGIVVALLLCFATAISYAELSKLYPGAGSSYFFAEQAFLSKTHAYKFARLAKFVIGWASHLYYWVYPGVMVGVTAIIVGYLASSFFPGTFSSAVNSPTLMIGFCVLFAFGVAFIAYNGVTGSTGVNIAVNVIQISALLVFSVIAIGYRLGLKEIEPGTHKIDGINVCFSDKCIPGNYWAASSSGMQSVPYKVLQEDVLDADGKKVPDKWPDGADKKTNADGKPDDKGELQYKQQDRMVKEADLDAKAKLPLPAGIAKDDPFPDYKKDKDGKPKLDKDGKIQPLGFVLSYAKADAVSGTAGDPKDPQTFNYHENAASVVTSGTSPHNWNFSIIQACIAILILVGFESVTAMGEEAKNAKRDIPRAVILSLMIQGVVCYMIEYFAANFYLNSGYTLSSAAGSSAPIGDMMVNTGYKLLGSYPAGVWYMRIQAITVFLALIGTTLSCMNTGARVTYAMGRDDEVPSHFGMLHGSKLTPHRAIWTLAFVSTVIGILVTIWYLCGPSASDAMNTALDSLKDNPQTPFWYPKFLFFSKDTAANLPNSFLAASLVSNFGTFMLYMLTCVIAIVAFREHHMFNGIKHMVIPVFGLVANFLCMLFYLVGPFTVNGMSWKESYLALGIAAVWGAYGAVYFARSSKKKGKAVLIAKPAGASEAPVTST
jgi:amino acid transporter